jgi:Neocarzinostatin family
MDGRGRRQGLRLRNRGRPTLQEIELSKSFQERVLTPLRQRFLALRATVTVTPCSGLATPTALVDVTGTGFTPSVTVVVVECVPPVTSAANCDAATASFTTATGTGTISLVGFVVHESITIAGVPVTCLSSGNCSVLASTFPQTATTPANDETIGFSAPPSPSPTPVTPVLPAAGSGGPPGAGSQVGLLLGIAALLLAPLVVALARRRYQDHKPVA